MLYGLSEIAFGVCAAGYVGWQAEGSTLSRLTAFGAAVYIVVRGFDNFCIGRDDVESLFALWFGSDEVKQERRTREARLRGLLRNIPELYEPASEKGVTDQSTTPPGPGRS